jgi:hypothetical protein
MSLVSVSAECRMSNAQCPIFFLEYWIFEIRPSTLLSCPEIAGSTSTFYQDLPSPPAPDQQPREQLLSPLAL